jgi:hypothetical protein
MGGYAEVGEDSVPAKSRQGYRKRGYRKTTSPHNNKTIKQLGGKYELLGLIMHAKHLRV